MQTANSKNKITLKNFENFDLGQTFDCGQCFRFEKVSEGKYRGVAFGKILQINQTEGEITLEDTSAKDFEEIWKAFFDLETNYEAIRQGFCKIGGVLSDACTFSSGIRILRQDPWEALCSFIISQNNNIPRIKKIIRKLCETFGEKIGKEDFAFPTAKRLAKLSPEDLAPIKCGFRAKYIIDAAKKVANEDVDLEKLKTLPADKAAEILTSINGVGPKVSSCVLLYGLHKLEAFPLDVWMKRVMSTYFKGKSPKIFGKYAGVAQQYLFYYSRENSSLLF